MPNQTNRNRSLTPQFQSLPDLIRHFERRLPIQEIEKVILETGQLFTCRGADTEEMERASFLNRCHRALQGSILLHEDALLRHAEC